MRTRPPFHDLVLCVRVRARKRGEDRAKFLIRNRSGGPEPLGYGMRAAARTVCDRRLLGGLAVLLCGAFLTTVAFAAQSFELLRDIAVDAGTAKREGATGLVWSDGRRYDGDLSEGLPHGEGALVLHEGTRARGRFYAGRLYGEAQIFFADGRRFRGVLHNGVPQGLGTLRWPDKARYTGEYEAGERAGWGEFRSADGARYVGGYAAGEREGQGTHIDADGTLFRGAFRAGRREGYGVTVSANGSSLTLERWSGRGRDSSKAIRRSEHCRLIHGRHRWMVRGSACIDGLAHGQGNAVSIDGTQFIENGRFVLGRLVEGRTIALGQPPQEDA